MPVNLLKEEELSLLRLSDKIIIHNDSMINWLIDFGLIWDGGSTKGMDGVGAYLRYNNPHKVFLYISQGLPVIIWKESALASFIVNNSLGFRIEALDEIDAIMKTISIEKYREISNNVEIIGENLRRGYFIENAMLEALDA